MTIAQLEAKLTQNPGSPLFARLADEYLAAGKVKEARALCITGLQKFTAYPTAYLVLARCCEAEGDTQSALDSVSIALEYFPFAPILHDLQLELTSTSAPLTEDLSESIISEVPPTAEIAEMPEEATIVEAGPELSEESGLSSLEETTVAEGMTAETPLEDELRRSLEEHLHEVLDGEPVAGAPAETPVDINESVAEITLPEENLTSPDDVQVDAVEPADTIQESSKSPSEETSPSNDHDETVGPSNEIEQFFNERISELQVESLPEVEPPPAVNETPVEEAPPAAAVKPVYVPPPPVPEEADTLDETTSLGVDGRIVSRTLAEIYVMQGAIAEAILTYQMLKLEKPELRAECDARIRELEPKLQEKPSS